MPVPASPGLLAPSPLNLPSLSSPTLPSRGRLPHSGLRRFPELSLEQLERDWLEFTRREAPESPPASWARARQSCRTPPARLQPEEPRPVLEGERHHSVPKFSARDEITRGDSLLQTDALHPSSRRRPATRESERGDSVREPEEVAPHFVPYYLTTVHGKTARPDSEGAERGAVELGDTNCGAWEETESEAQLTGGLSDDDSVSTAAPFETPSAFPSLVEDLRRQTDDLNEGLDHLIRSLILHNKRAQLSEGDSDTTSETTGGIEAVKLHYQEALEKVQEARLRDRAKSDVHAAKLQSQLQNFQTENQKLQSAISEKDILVRRLQAQVKALRIARSSKSSESEPSEVDALFATLLIPEAETAGSADSCGVVDLTQTSQRLARNVTAGLKGVKKKDDEAALETPADILKAEFELKLRALRNIKGSSAPPLHEWLRVFVSAWRTLQTRLKSVSIPDKPTEKVLQLAKEKIEREKALSFKAVIQVQQECLRVMKQVFETPWRADELTKENKEKDATISVLSRDLDAARRDSATLRKELKRCRSSIEHLENRVHALSSNLGLCQEDLATRFEQVLETRGRLRETQATLQDTEVALEIARADATKAEDRLKEVFVLYRAAQLQAEDLNAHLEDKTSLVEGLQEDLERFEKANAELAEDLHATRVQLTKTTIELQAEHLAASQERASEVSEWHERHRRVEENLLAALKRPETQALRHSSRSFTVRVRSPRARPTGVFSRLKSSRSGGPSRHGLTGLISAVLRSANEEETRTHPCLLGSRARGAGAPAAAPCYTGSGARSDAEALETLEDSWKSIMQTVKRVERQVHAVYSSSRSHTVFARDLKRFQRLLEDLQPEYRRAEKAFELLRCEAEAKAVRPRSPHFVMLGPTGTLQRRDFRLRRGSKSSFAKQKGVRRRDSQPTRMASWEASLPRRFKQKYRARQPPGGSPERARGPWRLRRGSSICESDATPAFYDTALENSSKSENSHGEGGCRPEDDSRRPEATETSEHEAESLARDTQSSSDGRGRAHMLSCFHATRVKRRLRRASSAGSSPTESDDLSSRGSRRRNLSLSSDLCRTRKESDGTPRSEDAAAKFSPSRDIKRLEAELARANDIIQEIEQTLLLPQDYFKKTRDLTEENVRLNLVVCSLRADIERIKVERQELEALQQVGADYAKFQAETEKRIRDFEKQLKLEVAAARRGAHADGTPDSDAGLARKKLENMRIEHQLEIRTLRDMNALEVERLRQNHAREIEVLQQAIQSVKDNAELDYQKKCKLLMLQQDTAVEKMRCELETQLRDMRRQYEREIQDKQKDQVEALNKAEVAQQAALVEASRDFNKQLKDVEKQYEDRLLAHQVHVVKERDCLIARFKKKVEGLTAQLAEQQAEVRKAREAQEQSEGERLRHLAELERQLRAETLEKEELREALSRESSRAESLAEELGSAKRQGGRLSSAGLSDHGCQAEPSVRTRGTQVDETVLEYIRECTEISQEAMQGRSDVDRASDVLDPRHGDRQQAKHRLAYRESTFLSSPPPESVLRGHPPGAAATNRSRTSVLATEGDEGEMHVDATEEKATAKLQQSLKPPREGAAPKPAGSARMPAAAERLTSDQEEEEGASMGQEEDLFRRVAEVALRAKSGSLEPPRHMPAENRARNELSCATGVIHASSQGAVAPGSEDRKPVHALPPRGSSPRSSARGVATPVPGRSPPSRREDRQAAAGAKAVRPETASALSSASASSSSPVGGSRAKALEALRKARPDASACASSSRAPVASASASAALSKLAAGGGLQRRADDAERRGSSTTQMKKKEVPSFRKENASVGGRGSATAERGGPTDSDRQGWDGNAAASSGSAFSNGEDLGGRGESDEASGSAVLRAAEEEELLRLLRRAADRSETDLNKADCLEAKLSQGRSSLLRDDSVRALPASLDSVLQKFKERLKPSNSVLKAIRDTSGTLKIAPAGSRHSESRPSSAAAGEYAWEPRQDSKSQWQDRERYEDFRNADRGEVPRSSSRLDHSLPREERQRGGHDRTSLFERRWEVGEPRNLAADPGSSSASSLLEALSATSHQMRLERSAVKYGLDHLRHREGASWWFSGAKAAAAGGARPSLADQMETLESLELLSRQLRGAKLQGSQ
ncbi:hypothetical protein BESB_061120 [Besnoitia besnoiti]|uniref:Uncharacterized protein n=1 Tax=Besnoitia besnoiti TaxID=94643 RepID=A0A2A9MB68_BESBE|nr:hypothetical protein BESB_061120 [Besnoitia besnoiti]PFH35225.1 hypothetical protein BESB_061120 [Besnoitia besnoiti]